MRERERSNTRNKNENIAKDNTCRINKLKIQEERTVYATNGELTVQKKITKSAVEEAYRG